MGNASSLCLKGSTSSPRPKGTTREVVVDSHSPAGPTELPADGNSAPRSDTEPLGEAADEVSALAPFTLRVGSKAVVKGALSATASGRLLVAEQGTAQAARQEEAAAKNWKEASDEAADGQPPLSQPSTKPPPETGGGGGPDGSSAGSSANSTPPSSQPADASPNPVADTEAQERLKRLQTRLHTVLANMGVDIQLSPSPPFIGLLEARIETLQLYDKSLADSATHLRAYFEGDKTTLLDLIEMPDGAVPDFAARGGAGGADGTYLLVEAVPLCFIATYSDSIFEVGIRSKGKLLASCGVKIKDLQQGDNCVKMQLLESGAKAGSTPVGQLEARVRYTWLRGTRDDGRRTYSRRGKISIKPRRTREGILHIRDLFVVNHRILSHDNIWSIDDAEGQSPDLIQEASQDAAEQVTALPRSGQGQGQASQARPSNGRKSGSEAQRGGSDTPSRASVASGSIQTADVSVPPELRRWLEDQAGLEPASPQERGRIAMDPRIRALPDPPALGEPAGQGSGFGGDAGGNAPELDVDSSLVPLPTAAGPGPLTTRGRSPTEALAQWYRSLNAARTGVGPSGGGSPSGGAPDVPKVASCGAAQRLFETALLDELAPREEDTGEIRAVKNATSSLMLAMSDRISALERIVDVLCHAQQPAASSRAGPSRLLPRPSAAEPESEDRKADRARRAALHRPYVLGHFEYGIGRPAIKVSVVILSQKAHDEDDVRRAFEVKEEPGSTQPGQAKSISDGLASSIPELHVWGEYRTTAGGDLKRVEPPARILQKPGLYSCIALLPVDNTFAYGSLFLLRPGTKIIVMDVDGVLTTGDVHMVASFGLSLLSVRPMNLVKDYDPKIRPHAATLCRLWAAKGYQLVYVSGRQGSWYTLTVDWLIKHGFPAGPIQLTRTHMPTLPISASVGAFKLQYCEDLKEKGFELYAAYGNTSTDVNAYEAAGIPKERTYIIEGGGAESWLGKTVAGAKGTQKVLDWTHHIAQDVLPLPDADVKVPYVDIGFGTVPGYLGSNNQGAATSPTGSGRVPATRAPLGSDPASGRVTVQPVAQVTSAEPEEEEGEVRRLAEMSSAISEIGAH